MRRPERANRAGEQLYGEIGRVIAGAFEAEAGTGDRLAAELAASALVAALRVAEESAAARMQEDGRALGGEEIDRLFDDAVAFAEAGVAAIAARRAEASDREINRG